MLMRFGLLLISSLLLFGCVATTQDPSRLERDLAEMKRRLARLETQQATATAGGVAESTLQRQLAETVAGLDTLRVDFQSINGRLDDMGRSNQQLEEELRLSKDDLGLQLTDLNNRVTQLEMTAGSSAAPSVPAKGSSVEQTAAQTPEQLYQQALDLIRKQNQFAEGRQLLEEFASKYPNHELYVNALYWSGESYYGEKKYEQAILKLQDVISQYPKHPKAAAAMLKQALAFNALGDGQNARTTMQKLLEDYPDSEQAAAAKKYLAQ